jgi:hypothetical protein
LELLQESLNRIINRHHDMSLRVKAMSVSAHPMAGLVPSTSSSTQPVRASENVLSELMEQPASFVSCASPKVNFENLVLTPSKRYGSTVCFHSFSHSFSFFLSFFSFFLFSFFLFFFLSSFFFSPNIYL